jgi:hypothetical protein
MDSSSFKVNERTGIYSSLFPWLNKWFLNENTPSFSYIGFSKLSRPLFRRFRRGRSRYIYKRRHLLLSKNRKHYLSRRYKGGLG